jgi:hypothetical protein
MSDYVFKQNYNLVKPTRFPLPHEQIVFGVSWGKVMSVVGISVDQNKVLFVTSFSNKHTDRMHILGDKWNPSIIMSDCENPVALQRLWDEGFPLSSYNVTTANKYLLIKSLVAALDSESLYLLEDDALLDEMYNYLYYVDVLGNVRFHSSDRYVLATALAWYAAKHFGSRISFI